MEILLTGATGFIGSHLRKALSVTHQVSAIARGACKEERERVIWIPADLEQANFTDSLPEKLDAVLVMAQAREYRDFPEQVWPIFNVNIRSLIALLEYARCHGAKKFIFASSANVYQRSTALLREDSAIAPASFYAHSKRIGEMLVETYAPWFQCVILRLFTVYGHGQAGSVISSLIDRVRQQRPITVEGQRGLCLSPIEVTDVCTVIQTVLEQPASPGLEIFNVSGDEGVSIHELGLKIGAVLRVPPRFEFVDGEEPLGWMGDSSKLKRTFRLRPFQSLDHGLRRTVDV